MANPSILFTIALLAVVSLGLAAARRARWVRDVCIFLLLLGTTEYDLGSINFYSREWYRGTTRGFEVCWLDFLWMIVLGDELRSRRAGQRGPLPCGLVIMLMFVAYSGLNVAMSEPRLFGLFELTKMLRAVMVFVTVACYVKRERELHLLSSALSAAVVYEFCAALHARVALGHARAEGTLAHPNSLSMYNLIAIPVLLAVSTSDGPPRLRRASGVAALLGTISILLTVSRSGLVSVLFVFLGVAVTCGSLEVTAKKLAIGAAALAIGGAALAKMWPSYEARFAEGGLEEEYGGKVNEGRGAYLHLADRMVADRFWGWGLNNWSYWVSSRYGPRIGLHYLPYAGTDAPPPARRLRPNANVDNPHAAPGHSLYAITLGETGWPGVALYGGVWARWAQMTGRFLFKRSRAFRSRFGVGVFFGLVGAFCQSLSEWEIRQTPLLFLLHILLGAVAAFHNTWPPREPALDSGASPALRRIAGGA